MRETPSFDSLMNMSATVDDVSIQLIEEYLTKVHSGLSDSDLSKEDLLSSMRLLRGPKEAMRTLNAALMMFSDKPSRFFAYAQVDVVFKSDLAGNEMEEYTFDGPVDSQIRGAVSLLRERAVREKVIKPEGQAESVRAWSYPVRALQEAVCNAVFHKSYQVHEQVTVTVLPDCIEVLNFPGPDLSIPDEKIGRIDMRSSRCRNKRLGEFLKELRLAESRNTGIAKILQEMDRNGSGEPVFETDSDRTYMRLTMPIHPLFVDRRRLERKASRRRSTQELRSDILHLFQERGCMSVKEISEALGYSNVSSSLRRHISELMEEGRLVYRYPDEPYRPDQKVCYVRRDSINLCRL